jgi:hypothetical protein
VGGRGREGGREGVREGGRNDPNIVCTYEFKKKYLAHSPEIIYSKIKL